MESFYLSLEGGKCGDNVGTLLRGVEKEDMKRGQVAAAVGSVKSWTRFKAQVHALTQTDGGTSTSFGIDNKYSPRGFLENSSCYWKTYSVPIGPC